VEQPEESRKGCCEARAQDTRGGTKDVEADAVDARRPDAAAHVQARRRRAHPAGKVCLYRAMQLQLLTATREKGIKLPNDKEPLDPKTQAALDELRQPLNVRAVNMRPLRREPQYGVPVCDLQLRTYSIQNLTLFADFAVRAAYYMGLSARGPIPLPRITERWTVPRDVFIFKKSQENFERITMRRLIQIQDGHPDVVKAWLAFLAEHQYHGVGMKANIWEYEDLETATRAGEAIQPDDKSRRREGAMMAKVDEILNSKGFKEAMKGYKAPEDIEFRR
jgi:small subunit ribosomal protein S10